MKSEDRFSFVAVKVIATPHSTDLAILVKVDASYLDENGALAYRTAWIPRSRIAPHSDVKEWGDSGVLVIPKWLAVEKKLPFEEPDPNVVIDLE